MCLHQQKKLALFARDTTGSWQACWEQLEVADECHAAVMAPSGQYLVAVIGGKAIGSASVYQYDLSTHQGHIIGPGYSVRGACPALMISWPSIPAAWPQQLYAYIHDTVIRPTGSHTALDQSVRLVNSSTRSILGSWKVFDGIHAVDPLLIHGMGITGYQLQVSRNGKHLAVFCTRWVRVLSFGSIE